MAYENNNRNSTPRRNAEEDVNTNGIMLKNYDRHKFLTCSFWNKACVIEIGSIPEGAENDFSVLRKVQTIKQVMSFNTLTTLDQICEDAIESIKKTGQLVPAGAPCGANFTNLVEITDGSNLGLEKGVYLAIYKDWDQNRQTQKMDVYTFSTRTIIRGYDHNTGRCNEAIDKLRDFKDFALWVHETCKAFTYAQAHAIQEISKKDRFGTMKAISLVAASLGVDIAAAPAKSSYAGGSGGYRNNGGDGYQKKPYGGGNRGYTNGGYKNGSTGYRGGSTGGFQSNGNSGYNKPAATTPFSQDTGVDLELNMSNVSDIPIDQFV